MNDLPCTEYNAAYVNASKRSLALLLPALLAGGIAGVAGGLLFGQQRHQLVGLFALGALGGFGGLDLGQDAGFLGGLGLGGGTLGGQALFLFLLALALLAGGDQ